ncbi:hypothetical protein SHI21_14740 [Bacteriovorax sp. PP10]|uniref:Peptidase S9 prolyl oligopeptidase catalytic domain-containing protein n=1 Tax=Bacteriovorax antarcticus TaxID=3088717 RepID=A0ABU5VXZ9_9BACT|nr:hypothetical protein [Bacteriovorax sp. PP10]MEA9357482.1 hypothetical protein [Bacteriovorax sp. PP10]
MKTLIAITLFTILTQTYAADSVTAVDSKRHYDIYQMKTEIPEGNFEASIYLPTTTKIKAMLVLTPTIAGVTIIEKSNAQYFSKAGYLIIIPLPYKSEVDSAKPDIVKLDDEFYKPAFAADSFIALSETKFKLPVNLPVFAMGASQGGIRTLIIASHSARITASWFATAGGDFPAIYARSVVEKIASFRMKHMKVLGITDPREYEIYLREHLTHDPATACADIKTPFVQTMTLRDDKVPTANQELLVKSCPEHMILTLNTGHVAGSLSTVNWRHKIRRFFEESL